MRYLLAALLIAGFALSAHAQGMGGTGVMGGAGAMSGAEGGRHHGQRQNHDDPSKRKVDEKAYKSALDRLPDQKFDPWGGVRETPQPSKPASGAR